MAAAQQALVSSGIIGVTKTYATWDSANKAASFTLSGGDLTVTNGVTIGTAKSTLKVKSGKWYWENTNVTTTNMGYGIANPTLSVNTFAGNTILSAGYYNGGQIYNANVIRATVALHGVGAVIGVALDADNNTVSWYKDNVFQYSYTLAEEEYYAAYASAGAAGSCTTNFGASAFTYSPPTGYSAGLFATNVVYATLDPFNRDLDVVLAGGDLSVSCPASTTSKIKATNRKLVGKWYWEVVPSGGSFKIGATSEERLVTVGPLSGYVAGYYWYGTIGKIISAYSGAQLATVATYTAGDVLGFALDMDLLTISFYKNNVFQTQMSIDAGATLQPLVVATGGIMPALKFNSATTSCVFNFGESPLKYVPPAGYNAGLYSPV